MKKRQILFLTAIIFFITSCTKKITEPNQIGEQVFEILKKDITKMDKDTYSNYLLSINEAKNLGNSEEYLKEILDNQNEIIVKNNEEKIEWNKIEYLDFKYKTKSKGVGETIRGVLAYKFETKVYETKVFAVWIDDEYRIVNIVGIYPKNN